MHGDPDNPEWTEEDFARALPTEEVIGLEAANLLAKGNNLVPGDKGWSVEATDAPALSLHPLSPHVDRPGPYLGQWRIHTARLLNEVMNNPQCAALKVPINLLCRELEQVAAHALRINDPELMKSAVRLTLFEEADPYSKDYNPSLVDAVLYGKNEEEE